MSNSVLLDGILRNLLRNAVNYTEPGRCILVGCRRLDVRIGVYDTGVGMRPSTFRGLSLPFLKGTRRYPPSASSAPASMALERKGGHNPAKSWQHHCVLD